MSRQRLIPQAIYNLLRASRPSPSALYRKAVFHPYPSCRASSSATQDPTPRPKRPSPYRLIPPHTFLAEFAPLHVAGWRLDQLPSLQPQGGGKAFIEDGMADLQDRRLIRLYEFEMGKQGWKDLMGFMNRIGEMIAEQDHHPKILITPAQDYITTIIQPISSQSGYLLEISTHTHTPLPASPSKSGQTGQKEKMRPGVTMKDLRLAEAVEGVWKETSGIADL